MTPSECACGTLLCAIQIDCDVALAPNNVHPIPADPDAAQPGLDDRDDVMTNRAGDGSGSADNCPGTLASTGYRRVGLVRTDLLCGEDQRKG